MTKKPNLLFSDKITWIKLKDLKNSPHQRNKHRSAGIERMAKLMREFGVRQLIHISTLSNTTEMLYNGNRPNLL